MVKKVAFGTLLLGLIAVLVAGAIIRTVDRTENVEARGSSQGRGAGQEAERVASGSSQDLNADVQRQGRGGYGQGTGITERQYLNYADLQEWVLYEGTVTQVPTAGVDLIIETNTGQKVTIGTGPGFMEDQGFTLQAGEQVQVRGYWEGNELKAAQVTRLRDGATITLRDEVGRPAWAGGGQGAQAKGRGGHDGQGRTEAPGDGTRAGQAGARGQSSFPFTPLDRPSQLR
jgi:hypothetical protein